MTRTQRRAHAIGLGILSLLLALAAIFALGSGRSSWARAEAIRSPTGATHP